MPKLVDHERFRVDLLRRSFDWIAENGLAHVTMRGLARELGVSTGVLYHYFPNRDEFLSSLLSQLAEADIARGRVRLGAGDADRLAAFAAFITSEESYFQKMLLLLFDSLRFTTKTRSAVAAREVFRRIGRQYKSAIQKELGFSDPHQADTILSLIIGTLVQRMMDPSEADFTTILGGTPS